MADARLTDAEVRAHRVAAHQLATGAAAAGEVAVLDTGIQDTPPGTTAGWALRARLREPGAAPDDGRRQRRESDAAADGGPSRHHRPRELDTLAGDTLAGDGLALVHAARGAMHLHRAADLPMLAAALRPDSSADVRKQQFGPFFAALDRPIGSALDEVAGAMADVMADGVRRSKGDLSTAIQATVDKRLRPWCPGCAAHHVDDALFRLASLPAGLRLVPNGDGSADFVAGPPTPHGAPEPARRVAAAGVTPENHKTAHRVTAPAPTPADQEAARRAATPAPTPGDQEAARRELVRRFLRYAGPTNRDGLAAWLALSPAAARRWWELAEVVPVEIDGRRLFMHADDLATAPQPAHGVRLLPPYDPVLELGDRALLVPDAAQRKQVWRATANPGVLLADGAVAGIWRRRRGTVTVTPFAPLSASHRRALAAAAGEEVVVAES